MTQSAVEFLYNELWELPKDKFTWNPILSKAKEMEKEQMNLSEIKGISNTINYKNSIAEISDEEIEKIVDDQFGNIHSTYDEGIIYGMKLYREQLKNKI
jgi:hypothetical protein